MPVYTYACRECGKRQEAVRRVSERGDCPPCDRCYGPTDRRIVPTMVSTGFRAYRTVVHDKETGKPMLIRSRGEHQAFLSRNGYEEVGTDRSMAPRHPEEIVEKRKIQLKEREEAIAASRVFEMNADTHEAQI